MEELAQLLFCGTVTQEEGESISARLSHDVWSHDETNAFN
jgi:hypothetical protein